MRIAILAHALSAGGGISVGQNIISSLCRLAPRNDYFISIPSGLGYEDICAAIPRGEVSIYSGRSNLFKRWRYEVFELPRLLRTFRPDVILALGNKGVSHAECPQAILCHSSYMFYPKEHFGMRSPLEMLKVLLMISIQRACIRRDLHAGERVLLCQTPVTEKRMRKSFDYHGRTLLCPNAISAFTRAGRTSTAIPERLKPYENHFRLFYLTRYYPHKNLEAIVRLFSEHRESLHDTVVFLTISADQRPGARRLLRSICKHGLEDCIVNLGPLPQHELAGYFNHCHALLMPTLLESFSGTYLEAMHFGLPILTSDLDFAHEVCGDAALYFDPWDVGSIKDAILRLKNDPYLGDDLVEKGQARLSQCFGRTWDDIAGEIQKELESLVAGEQN